MILSLRATLVSMLSVFYAVVLVIVALAFEVSILVVNEVESHKYDVLSSVPSQISYFTSNIFVHLNKKSCIGICSPNRLLTNVSTTHGQEKR